MGQVVRKFIIEKGDDPTLIAWHGHTLFHDPQKATCQIGDPAGIVAATGHNVVAQFRTIDIALGGQGAPLAPIADHLLLESADFYLNLGGISNMSFRDDSGNLLSFDISPCNQLLNHLAEQKGLRYDPGGSLAAEGQENVTLLKQLDELDYYHKQPPKSLDNNWIQSTVIPILDQIPDQVENKLHTCCVHIAKKIAIEVGRSDTQARLRTMIVTGGGAHNQFLMKQVAIHCGLQSVDVKLPDPLIIDFKEAAMIALMGFLFVERKRNVLSKVTGSRRDHIGGCLYRGWHKPIPMYG